MPENNQETEACERAELLRQIEEVTAKIQQKVAALMAHPNVPEIFKTKLAEISGDLE